MQASSLSLTARTLYAELHELAMAQGATEALGPVPGAVVRKRLKGGVYLYYQYRDLDGRTRQAYLGSESEQTHALVESIARHAQTRTAEWRNLDEVRAAFVAAGGRVMEHGPLRVLKGFVDAGVLLPGQGYAALIGTHGFNALGNLLGVRWANVMQTQDIDLAAYADVDLGIPRPNVPAPDVLERLGMGFLPVPALDPRAPSTSFRIRGQALRVDLLTPLTGKPATTPVFVPALNALAQPLRFLDYLLDELVPVVVVGRATQLLVNVPAPARFALHKLLVSELRGAGGATKASKDRAQAFQLLEVLREEAPDEVPPALTDLVARGDGWRKKFDRALERAPRTQATIVEWLRETCVDAAR